MNKNEQTAAEQQRLARYELKRLAENNLESLEKLRSYYEKKLFIMDIVIKVVILTLLGWSINSKSYIEVILKITGSMFAIILIMVKIEGKIVTEKTVNEENIAKTNAILTNYDTTYEE